MEAFLPPPEPLPQPLSLQCLICVCAVLSQVLCVGNLYNPDVRYSFNIPIEEHREQFVWDPSGSWLECSRVCQGTTAHTHRTSHQILSTLYKCHMCLCVCLTRVLDFYNCLTLKHGGHDLN